MRRLYRALAVILAAIVVAFAWQRIFGSNAITPHLVSNWPVAAIGSGEDAVAIAGDGTVLAWFPEGSEPAPVAAGLSRPKRPRVRGPALEQVRVLAATPGDLRPYVARSYFGESGVGVELSSGIELRFGNAFEAGRKWRAAAAVLADPEVTALDYVDLHAPGRPGHRRLWAYASAHSLNSRPQG